MAITYILWKVARYHIQMLRLKNSWMKTVETRKTGTKRTVTIVTIRTTRSTTNDVDADEYKSAFATFLSIYVTALFPSSWSLMQTSVAEDVIRWWKIVWFVIAWWIREMMNHLFPFQKNYILFKLIMIEITVNDRLGKKVRVKCNGDDTIGDLKKLIAAQVRTMEPKSVGIS